MRIVLNILWLVLAGIWMAIAYVIAGVILCITIIGIPFGKQSFKLAGYALWPFGRALVPSAEAPQGTQRDREHLVVRARRAGGSRSAI